LQLLCGLYWIKCDYEETWPMPRTDPSRYVDPVRATRTLKEAARLVGCGDLKIVELIKDRTLPAVRIGNRWQPTVAGLEVLLGKPIEELERHLVVAEAEG
jgi:excisionase family DNA binding protein